MTLHVAEYGSADRPTIVMLHGGGGAGWMWTPQIEALSPDYHMLVPDLPGQGRSTEAGRFTMAAAATQIASLIRSRATDGHAHVVGLSEGAQVAVELLAQHAAVVDSVIVSSALLLPMKGLGMLTSESVLRWTYRSSMRPFRNADWWIRWNMRSAAGVPEAYFPEFRESFRTLSEEGFVDLMRANQTYRLPARLDSVTARTLAVCGVGEHDVIRRSARLLGQAVPSARAYEVHAPGKPSLAEQHNWNLTAPAVFSAMVGAWIEGRALPQELVEVQVDSDAGGLSGR